MNVTYLLGAGASAYKATNFYIPPKKKDNKIDPYVPAIPVLSSFQDVFTDVENWCDTLIERLRHKDSFDRFDEDDPSIYVNDKIIPYILLVNISPDENKNSIEYLTELKKTIEKYRNVTNGFKTVDTYARKLYLRGKTTELRHLKAIIGLCLSLRQLYYGKDIRYDSFFSSLINKKGNINAVPNNVNFISWNYDFMVEQTLQDFDCLTENHYNILPSMNYSNSFDTTKPYLIKLNGSANARIINENNSMEYKSAIVYYKYGSDLTAESFIEDLKKLLVLYSSASKSDQTYSSGILYAWEHMEETELIIKTRQKAQRVLDQTDILVIIGYSFPIFNRTIDNILLKNCNPQKVYLQIPSDSFNDVKSRLLAIKENWYDKTIDHRRKGITEPDITTINSVDEFYVPNELTLSPDMEDLYYDIGVE